MRIGVGALLALPLLCGCGALNTRPGHPDSWKSSYYDQELKGKAWPTVVPRELAAAQATSPAATPVYQTAKTPGEIWQARGYAFNLHLKYEAAAFKAQDVQDQLEIPLFGAAIATVATGLAKAGTVAVAATGLGGASLGAGVSYLHPDKDAATDQTADAALLCVVDQSKILNDMSAVPLVLDRAALQDALSLLRKDFGPLLTGASANTQGKAAVQAVETAAESSIKALDAAIAAYVALPGELFMAVDTIDQAAKTAGARTMDYNTILKTIQTSATNQSATDKAKAEVQTATTAADGAKLPSKSSSNTPPPTPTLNAAATALVSALTETIPAQTSDQKLSDPKTADQQLQDQKAAAQKAADQKAAITDTMDKKTEALKSLLNASGVAVLSRVNLLAKAGLDDIPNPNFSAVAGSIQTCAARK